MLKILKNIGLLLMLVVGVVVNCGCIALFVGAAAGAGGYAWAQGDLEKEFNTSAERLHKAVVSGLKHLDLPVKDDNHDRLSARVTTEFADGQAVAIHVSAITERSAKLKIRVGVFGSKQRSEMILTAIQKGL